MGMIAELISELNLTVNSENLRKLYILLELGRIALTAEDEEKLKQAIKTILSASSNKEREDHKEAKVLESDEDTEEYRGYDSAEDEDFVPYEFEYIESEDDEYGSDETTQNETNWASKNLNIPWSDFTNNTHSLEPIFNELCSAMGTEKTNVDLDDKNINFYHNKLLQEGFSNDEYNYKKIFDAENKENLISACKNGDFNTVNQLLKSVTFNKATINSALYQVVSNAYIIMDRYGEMENVISITKLLCDNGANFHTTFLDENTTKMTTIYDMASEILQDVVDIFDSHQGDNEQSLKEEARKEYIEQEYVKNLENMSKMIILGLDSPSDILSKKDEAKILPTYSNNSGYTSDKQNQGESIEYQKKYKVIQNHKDLSIIEPKNGEIYLHKKSSDEVEYAYRRFADGEKVYGTMRANGINEALKKLRENNAITEKFPIGYNIYIPENISVPVKKVIINVYGGYNKESINKSSLNTIDSHSKLLYEQGYCVIDLQLPDLLQDKLQFDMDEYLHNIIHDCINEFYETLHQNPENIDPDLKEMGFQNADYYLIGASFGGRTAIRHSQLYPDTFTGYISHDGALAVTSDMPIVGKTRIHSNAQTVIPANNIGDNNESMLLLQNLDDNNINLQNATKFYKKLKANDSNTSEKTRLCFFEKGNPSPSGKLHNKGHYIPEDIDTYTQVLTSYIENGVKNIPEMDPDTIEMYNLQAKRFLRKSKNPDSLEKQTKAINSRFIAEAYLKYLKNVSHRRQHNSANKEEWNKIWKSEYEPMLLAIEKIDNFTKNEVDYLEFVEFLKTLDPKELDDALKRTINYHADIFIEMYRELHGEKISKNDICDSPSIRNEFKERLFNLNSAQSHHYRSFILENFIFANPSIMSQFVENSPSEQITGELEERMDKLKEEFDKKIRMTTESGRRKGITVSHEKQRIQSRQAPDRVPEVIVDQGKKPKLTK